MPEKLNIFICEHFREETLAVTSSVDFKDVIPVFLPSRCGRPRLKENEFSSIKELATVVDRDRILCGCACLSKDDKDYLSGQNIRYLSLENCFQMFCSKDIIDSLINNGAYIVTPGWLSDWPRWVNEWGGQEMAKQMFSDSLTKVVLLDTGIDQSDYENLEDFAAALNLPAEKIYTGIDYYRLFLLNIVLQWRLEKHIKHSADYAMAMDLLSNLPRAEREDVVAQSIMEVFAMLFAPGIIYYLSVEDGKPEELWSDPEVSDKASVKNRLFQNNNLICKTESGRGFRINIGQADNRVAVIEIDDIANPEYLSHYQNICLSLSGVFELAVVNARYFQQIFEMRDKLSELNNTKDKFFSIIAHDLKSPFSSIIGFSELLMENKGEFDKEKTDEFINIIADSSKYAYELLENLLIWSRSQTGKIEFNPQPLNVKECIEGSIKMIQGQSASKSIGVISNIDDDVSIVADKNMIDTVLRNLLSNAIKFTPRNGRITISANLSRGEVEIAVSDNGVGIPEKDIDRIFKVEEKISTAGTEKEKGTGLGLVLCREFIEKHKGRIWAESEEGKGSRFLFTIPINAC